jgi:thymidylate synthase (FAD)
MARVSNPESQTKDDPDNKLLKYLVRNKHWSPFEMVNVCLEITTTRDIARQILRHRSFSFQEFSQRYADPTKELSFQKRETRLQDVKNRQNSIENNNLALATWWQERQNRVINEAKEAYAWAIENGIAKEQARVVLPEGNTTSKMYMNGTLRSWIHYVELRTDNATQKEHREVALQCKDVMVQCYPFLEELWQHG